MLTKEMEEILVASRATGWVLEPMAKRLFAMAGLKVPRFHWAKTMDEAVRFAGEIGYPVVGKVVSPLVMHKSDRKGVVVGIQSDGEVKEAFLRLSRIEGFHGMLVEEMVSGVELIVGAKVDVQFGPVILLGIGGTGVEIYRDVVLRMAPLEGRDVGPMIRGLRARVLLEGYRGSEPVRLGELERLLVNFSALVMDLRDVMESIDLNPVMCSSVGCFVADARIILKSHEAKGEGHG